MLNSRTSTIVARERKDRSYIDARGPNADDVQAYGGCYGTPNRFVADEQKRAWRGLDFNTSNEAIERQEQRTSIAWVAVGIAIAAALLFVGVQAVAEVLSLIASIN